MPAYQLSADAEVDIRDLLRHANGIVVRLRHLILDRIATADLIGIGRILHDAMEMERHLPTDYGVVE
ncbi:hypothetical protein [Reyranella sp. CPCC 100927]|uniref:hypothetical protein n=1 Tax=Reyranella sp. CPCC 100927 TaxID=2599616 RepID=UPI0011B6A4DE|nr:hypothetical protein [Reyranella sp. CPCC 100927]TWS93978.1 hypothetical protein FQU96_41550 [Reyranella sp. CPCC 100927]